MILFGSFFLMLVLIRRVVVEISTTKVVIRLLLLTMRSRDSISISMRRFGQLYNRKELDELSFG